MLTETMTSQNNHFKHNKFSDKVREEKNHNNLRHMKNGAVFGAVAWQANLRDRADGFGKKPPVTTPRQSMQ